MKKHVIRMALAGALAFGVASVSKADEAAATASAPTFSAVAQELATQSFGTLSKTSTTGNATSGDQLSGSLQHFILGANYNIDSLDTLTVKTDLLSVNTNYFLQLTDGYVTHNFADLNAGLTAKAGQVRIAFGADGYTSPDQLIRTGYSSIDALIPGGKVNDGGSNYDLGLEIDQTYSDLTIQVGAVQNPNAVSTVNSAVGGGNGTQFDYVGRAQWKSSNIALGLSDYYQASNTGAVNNVNTLGANGSVWFDSYKLDLEAIFGANGTNGYTGTLSAKFDGFQPAVWYEGFTTSAGSAANAADLGGGVNFWLGSKTRLALDLDFTGNGSFAGAANGGDLLAKNTETVQLTESF